MKEQFESQAKALKDVLNHWPQTEADLLLKQIVETLRKGGAVVATALGKSVPVCEKFIGTLNSLGIKAHFLHTSSAIHGDLGKVSAQDLVLVLSKSGETDETVFLLEALKERQVRTWLMTCQSSSRGAQAATHSLVLHCPQEGDPWNLVPNNSTLIFLNFLQALAMKLIKSLQIKLNDFKVNHPGGAIGKVLKTS